MEKNFKRTTVTSALPYANGPVHIGHLAGVYVPADIYVRYLRLKKEDVLFIGGSDEHGVPITIRAKKEGITPQDVVDRYHFLIKKSFEEFGISFDVYSRTSSKTHHELASDFFKKLYEKGEFIEKTSEQYYDEEAHQFLADRYITGECPHCHSEGAYGDQCEKCGTSLSPTDLINPKSAISGSKPVMKETKHWYLPLDKHETWLRQWILEEHKEWRPNVYGQCKSWLDMGLQPRAVSRDLDWGIPVPVEGAEGKVLYVWFDAPIGYISNTKELLPDSWETWWKDPETRLVHFIGKDNIVFHCIVFPAMLKAEGSYILPDNVPSNEFLNLEGDKISTSRNWAVWLHEYLEDFPGKQDVLRYVLTANAPETKDNDFTWKDFQARNNNELVAVYGNFVNRAMVLTQKYFEGKVPAAGELTDYDKETLKEFSDVKAEVEKLLNVFKFRDAQKEAMNLARIGNKYLADTEPWKLAKTDMERVGTILNISLQLNFQKECAKNGLKHIFGYSLTMIHEEEAVNLKIYALNNEGLHNLLHIQSAVMVVSENNTIRYEQLLMYAAGCVPVFATRSVYWMAGHPKQVERIRKGAEAVYYQIDANEYKADRIDREQLEALKYYFCNCYDTERDLFTVEPILLPDCYYMDKDDAASKIIVNKIAAGAAHEQSGEQYFKTADELYDTLRPLFSEKWDFDALFGRMCRPTVEIAERAEAVFETGRMFMPEYRMRPEEVERYGNRRTMFLRLLDEGLKRKVPDMERYRERLDEDTPIYMARTISLYKMLPS